MEGYKVITIGREFGSGGHEIGNRLATRLDIPLYDNNLIRMVAEKLDIREETAQAVDETTLNSFLRGYVMSSIEQSSELTGAEYVPPLTEQVYELQSQIIRKLAARGPCVIVGRCADYVLRDHPELVSVFIHANMEFRMGRVEAEYHLPENKLKDFIIKTDKKRASYSNFQSEKKWGAASSYNLCLESSALGIDKCVDLILDYIRYRQN